jgi:hypothetical protein
MKALLFPLSLAAAILSLAVNPVLAQTRTIRIATYNIEADINGATSPLPGLIAPPTATTSYQSGGVLEGIGEELRNGHAQPLDVLALQETTSNPQTITPIVTALNTFYGIPGMYTNSTYQGTESGGDVADGNGPNALVFNTLTLQLVASTPVDPPGGTGYLGSSSGEYREVMRYELAPAGVTVTSSNSFYVYVSHYKSGTSSADLTDRTGEAKIIRNNEATALPAAARVIYVGDYNISSSSEASYTTILAATAPDGIAQGAGIDPMNPTDQTINWAVSTTSTNILAMETEEDYDLRYRDDLQVMTTNVYDSAPGGFAYVSGTYHVFGNNGTVAYEGSVNNANNTALNNRLVTNGPVFIPASQLLLDLTDASDHLPVVSDYTVPLPVPAINSVSAAGPNLVVTLSNCATNAVLTLLTATNLTSSGNTWTPVATNTAAAGSVAFTATNAVNASQPCAFFIIQEQ